MIYTIFQNFHYRIRSPGESLHIAHPLIEVEQAVTTASRGRVGGA